MNILKSMLVQLTIFLVLGGVFIGGIYFARFIYSNDIKAMNQIRTSAELVANNPYPAPTGQRWCEEVDIENLQPKKGEHVTLEMCSEVGR